MPIHFELTHSIFKEKYSKSSKFDIFLSRFILQVGRFICRLVGMCSSELLPLLSYRYIAIEGNTLNFV